VARGIRSSSTLGDAIAKIFGQVLAICQPDGLIGQQMFAIDAVKLPSNASKAKSGTRKDFLRQLDKMEQAAAQLIKRHREHDAHKEARDEVESDKSHRKLEKLERHAKQLRDFLGAHPNHRTAKRSGVRLSKRTDNESAKIASGKGVIQGYSAVAAADEQAQVIVAAQAHGTGSEQELLGPIVDKIKPLLSNDSVIAADSGYCSKDNLEKLEAQQIEGFIPDNAPRFVTAHPS